MCLQIKVVTVYIYKDIVQLRILISVQNKSHVDSCNEFNATYYIRLLIWVVHICSSCLHMSTELQL